MIFSLDNFNVMNLSEEAATLERMFASLGESVGPRQVRGKHPLQSSSLLGKDPGPDKERTLQLDGGLSE